ncbi:hypothetical protein [Streptomyces yangpuensis]|uniref:hypothetical protein n=1 Tax=Streptomyces yangpuensis TaxID=1648182 RepID=UPI00382FBACD
MTDDESTSAHTEPRSFLTCATEVARLLGVDDSVEETGDLRARLLAHAVRKPLLEREGMPEEWFGPLMAAAVHDPDPSFCRWFVEPAVYAFGRRRVAAALVDYLRSGTDAERAGAARAWYSAGVSVYPERSPLYGPGGVRDPALDELEGVYDAWSEASMEVIAVATDLGMLDRLLYFLPTSRADYPARLHPLLDATLATARAHPDPRIRGWARTAGLDAV